MKIFGFEITRVRKDTPATPSVPGSWFGNWWWPIIREPFTGAWQRNMEIRVENVLSYFAVYSCVTLIASDIAKLRMRLVQKDDDGIWTEIDSPSFSPVLRKPNRYQTRIKFFEQWIVSKLLSGNTFILKERDERNVVVRLYVLDPTRTKVLVAPDGAIFYELHRDNLSGIEEDRIAVPASEIIHDVMVPFYHPLCGVSPITACGLSAIQGLAIQRNSAKLFANAAQPGGLLVAPGAISDDTAKRLKEYWENNFTGDNAGKIAVLGDGLKFESLTMKAVDAQVIEQLKWSAETVASCFHVPPYMIGVGAMPTYNNIEALNQQYYTQCLQKLIEDIELLLDEGLGLTEVQGRSYGTEFDLDDLLRMDTATKVKSWGDLVKAGIAKPDEARARFAMKPVPGGDTPYLQQQNYGLAALAKRDAQDDPFASNTSPPASGNQPDDDEAEGRGENNEDAEGNEQDRRALIINIKDDLRSRAKRAA